MWTGNGNVTRQREGRELLLARFPAVCPCEAVCAAFPGWVASLPHPASKAALSRPVSRVYGGSRRTLEPLGRRGYGERFRCRKKRWRLFGTTAGHTAPQCGSGQRVAGFNPRSHFQAPAPLVAPPYHETPVSRAFRWRGPGASEIIEQEGDEPYRVG